MSISAKDIKYEKERLEKTKQLINEMISNLGQQLYAKKETIQKFQKFMWDNRHDMDPQEMKSMTALNDVEVTISLNKAKYFQKLFKIQNNPYFGAITFKTEDNFEKIYIGLTHLEDEDKHLIYDWRAPISSLFYDYGVGNANYLAPEGIVSGEITNKRQFKIEDGKLKRVFDNSLNVDDDVLQEVLSNSSSEKMKNIVNTIQQEQNEIIRNIDDPNLIVQGIAGSGKTSVALHRIAFLLYKINNLQSNNVLIFSPNQVFSEYISNVLPELGEDNTMQTTFSDFLTSFLPEYKNVESFTNFVERYYKYNEENIEIVKYKQSDEIIKHIDMYIEDFLNSIEFIDGLVTHDFEMSKEELNDLFKNRFSKFNLYDRLDAISDKICYLFYKGKKNQKSKIKAMLKRILNKSIEYRNIYTNFYNSKNFIDNYSGKLDDDLDYLKGKSIKYEDACLFVYIKGLIEGFGYKGTIKEVVIDEAQDYSVLQYIIIKQIFKKANFTILGDINQTINPYYKYITLNKLNEVFEDTRYLELTKTYRSSPEIIDYTNKILGLNHVSAIRNNSDKEVLFRYENNNLLNLLINDIENMFSKNLNVAIITKNDKEAKKIYDLLKERYNYISLIDSNTKEFSKKLLVIPSYVSKGLEFDSVIIYTEKNDVYTINEKNLFYVACTRTQHQLIIYNQ